MFWPSGFDADALKAELTGLIVGQRISYSATAQKRIQQICQALNGTLKVTGDRKNKQEMMSQQIKTFFCRNGR